LGSRIAERTEVPLKASNAARRKGPHYLSRFFNDMKGMDKVRKLSTSL